MEKRKYILWGLPFFNQGARMPEFEAGLTDLLAQV
jgi:hypothetical protein